jgi:Tfp pilus assembly protein PilX
MGSSVSSAESAVRQAEGFVKQAEAHLRSMKEQRDFAKKNGMYKNSAKTYRSGDKVGTLYDSNVWGAEKVLKERKAQLAEAKKRFSEAKKKK